MDNPRFIDNGDGTVTLPALGLMFTKATVTPECVTHAQAEAACAELRTAGHDDWRLPSTHELFALVDHSRFEPTIDTALFPDTKPDWYWTSTVCAWSSARAWCVGFGSGSCNYGGRGDVSGLVRAVRSVPADDEPKGNGEYGEVFGKPAAVPAGYALVPVEPTDDDAPQPKADVSVWNDAYDRAVAAYCRSSTRLAALAGKEVGRDE